MNTTTKNTIDSLFPNLRENATIIYNACALALTGRAKVVFLEGFRSAARSNYLYSLGRTVRNTDGYHKTKKPMGNIVTNAKAGQSIHNYGLAIDFVLEVDGKSYKWDSTTDFDGDKIADWMEVVKIFKAHGWEWGGDWKSIKDLPHVQYDYGFSWQKLQEMEHAGNLIPGTPYVDVLNEFCDNPVLVPNEFKATASLNIRSGPGTSHKVIGLITKGETVREIARSAGWSAVVFKGLRGYVSHQYLTK